MNWVRGLTWPSWFTPRRRALALLIGSAMGYGLALAGTVLLLSEQNGRIFDATLYWQAGRSVLDGGSPYGAIAIGTTSKAFFYAPIFAQLWAVFAVLPEPVFTWLWRTFCFGCLVWLAGGWRNAGLWLLFPLTLNEMANPNVTLPAAAATFVALRGRPWLLPLAGAVKFGPILVLPYIWLRRPEARRPLVYASVATAALCLVSFVIAPQMWFDFVGQMSAQNSVTTDGAGLVAILPTAGADFALRIALAAGLVAVAFALKSDRLAFAATTIAVPAFWVTRLVPLLALPRLPGRDRAPAEATPARTEVAQAKPPEAKPPEAKPGEAKPVGA
jgi:hypothetical protein